MAELNNKIRQLEYLLQNFDDGRRKSFFCTAVNLLDSGDLSLALAKIADETKPDVPKKAKSQAAARVLEDIAQSKNISLKLRKKP